MSLNKNLCLSLILGFIGLFLIIYGRNFETRLISSIGAIFLYPLGYHWIVGKGLKRDRLYKFFKRKSRLSNN